MPIPRQAGASLDRQAWLLCHSGILASPSPPPETQKPEGPLETQQGPACLPGGGGGERFLWGIFLYGVLVNFTQCPALLLLPP